MFLESRGDSTTGRKKKRRILQTFPFSTGCARCRIGKADYNRKDIPVRKSKRGQPLFENLRKIMLVLVSLRVSSKNNGCPHFSTLFLFLINKQIIDHP
jgi:hypothetical protein